MRCHSWAGHSWAHWSKKNAGVGEGVARTVDSSVVTPFKHPFLGEAVLDILLHAPPPVLSHTLIALTEVIVTQLLV